ncbi:hypothetical protein MC885_016342 [Smutsia gigantea]|nr:hypothetical protein MC885_016342 [Smutsia gigantea]
MAASTLSVCSSDLSYGRSVCLPRSWASCTSPSWQGDDSPESCSEPPCWAPSCCALAACQTLVCTPVSGGCSPCQSACTSSPCQQACCVPVCCKPVCCVPVCFGAAPYPPVLPAHPLLPVLLQTLLLRVPHLPSHVQAHLLRAHLPLLCPHLPLQAQLLPPGLLRVPALPPRVCPSRLLLTH